MAGRASSLVSLPKWARGGSLSGSRSAFFNRRAHGRVICAECFRVCWRAVGAIQGVPACTFSDDGPSPQLGGLLARLLPQSGLPKQSGEHAERFASVAAGVLLLG